MEVLEILKKAVEMKASDIFIVAGLPLTFKVQGVIEHVDSKALMPPETSEIIDGIYSLTNGRSIDGFLASGDDDFSFAVRGISRFRVNTYKQRGSLAAVIRVITFDIPSAEALHIPGKVIHMADFTNGLILVTGPAGCGKSTTLACMIDYINRTRENHIITLEDPLEYLHRHHKSIVSQREIYTDTESYVTALKASLRQSPDVILLGEMRDYETMDIAMTAAETGHLIISTLHTLGAANSIGRIIDVFPANQQRQVVIQLALVLRAVISQQLVPSIDGTLIPAFEVMTVNPAISTMIRDNKIHQIDGVIATSASEDMISMDQSLLNLYAKGLITKDVALEHSYNTEALKRKLKI
ncbi:MAG TPA: PilT/PilU family type 4a pilus ATPase [Lachnospiraceae bacterium]|nr:PilT/PilU family type 4a pilus ATPase [Lachnospiraceae bacterium]